MKTIREIRRENLIRLVHSYKSQRQFAQSVGLVPSHASQLLSGKREMGEEVARRIEEALGMPDGFMSLEPGTPLSMPVIEPALQILPSDELKLLTDYRRASPKHQAMAREMMAAYVKFDQAQQQQ